jgi:hypothetical protein
MEKWNNGGYKTTAIYSSSLDPAFHHSSISTFPQFLADSPEFRILTTCPEPVEGLTPIYWLFTIDLTKRRNRSKKDAYFLFANRKRDWTIHLVVATYFLLPRRATRFKGSVRYD